MRFVDRAELLAASKQLCHDWMLPSIFDDDYDVIRKLLCSTKLDYRLQGADQFLTSFMNRYDKANLRALFELARGANEFLKLNEPHYRDHFTHSIDVFLLGNYLMKECSRLRDLSHDLTVTPIYTASYTWLLLWGVTSLFHDVAYFFQKLSSALPARLTFDFAAPDFRFYPEFVAYLTDPERAYLNVGVEQSDHGVLSALWTLKEIDRLYYAAPADRYSLFKERFFSVGHAMALHNVPPGTPDIMFDMTTRMLSVASWPSATRCRSNEETTTTCTVRLYLWMTRC